MAEGNAEAARREKENRKSWRQFRNTILGDPGRLRDSTNLTGQGLSDLINLTRWLRGHTGHSESKLAALHWREVSAGFNNTVAEAYRDGMIQLWRVVSPERPFRRVGGGVTTKWANILSLAGIDIEASESPDWASSLSALEAALAATHACHCEEGYPDWLGPLLERHSSAVLPVVRLELETEWQAEGDNPGNLLHHFAYSRATIPQALNSLLLQVKTSSMPSNLGTAELGLSILQRLELDAVAQTRVARLATEYLENTPTNDDGRMLLGLALLFLGDAGTAVTLLKTWLAAASELRRKARAEHTLARLFGRDQGLVPGVLSALSTPHLSALAHFTYVCVSPADDPRREGSYEPDTRYAAEAARNAILNALVERSGEEAYLAVKGLAEAGIARIPCLPAA